MALVDVGGAVRLVVVKIQRIEAGVVQRGFFQRFLLVLELGVVGAALPTGLGIPGGGPDSLLAFGGVVLRAHGVRRCPRGRWTL